MAAQTKKKAGPNKRRNTKTNKQKQNEIQLQKEIIFLIWLAFTILLFLCNFKISNSLGEKTSIIGGFGNMLSSIMGGVFGLMCYIAPILFFLGSIFIVSNKGNIMAVFKLISAIVLFLLGMITAALFQGMEKMDLNVKTFYEYSKSGKGGGVIGGYLAAGMNSAFGKVGTIVLIIIVMIFCLFILMEKSFFSVVKQGSKKVYDTAIDDAERRKEQAQVRRAKHQQLQREKADQKLRMHNKVAGVAIDTAIRREEDSPENIHEITLNDNTADTNIEQQMQQALDALNQIKINGIEENVVEEDIDSLQIEKQTIHELKQREMQTSKTKEAPVSAAAKKPELRKEIPADAQDDLNVSKEYAKAVKPKKKYIFPPLSKLKKGDGGGNKDSARQLRETALHLQQTLQTFGVKVTITDISQGPSVTRYELQPEQGVKVSKIVNLADDIKLNLAATDIRIEAPIPGKAAVGIEVPNKENTMVAFRDLVESKDFKEFSSNLVFAVGKDIAGKVIVADIAKMPHLLIAGATGSGKSVCINTIIMSILYKAHPDDVKMIMIDPKVVELSVYNGIPHLMIPVVTDPKKAAAALRWGVAEMEDRYKKFADLNVRDLKGYNKKVGEMPDNNGAKLLEKLPQVVIIVDELADLMMVAPGEVEESICRLAQLARAAGIHLIIATQRPSVDVITGLIKANMPSRIAFAVSSGVDSRTILDMIGAEKLLGKGDMLFYPQGLSKPSRVQGAFISDKEVSEIVDFLKEQCIVDEDSASEVEEKIASISTSAGGTGGGGMELDAHFADAGKFIIDKDKASIGMLQRVFKVGFNRAARIMDQLADCGVVGEEEGTKPRKVLMSMEEFENLLEEL